MRSSKDALENRKPVSENPNTLLLPCLKKKSLAENFTIRKIQKVDVTTGTELVNMAFSLPQKKTTKLKSPHSAKVIFDISYVEYEL